MTLEEKIEANYLLGVVQYGDNIRFYMNPIAYWIMDSKAYDPTYNPANSPGAIFRDGIFTVDESNVKQFLRAIEPDHISLDTIKDNLPSLEEELTLYFLIDFDNKIFVNAYADVEIERYVPASWEGILDYPLNYLPDEIKQIWEE